MKRDWCRPFRTIFFVGWGLEVISPVKLPDGAEGGRSAEQ